MKGEYIALITQSGTSDPLVQILQDNTMQGTTWKRVAPGTYEFRKDSSFMYDEPVPSNIVYGTLENGAGISFQLTESHVITVKTYTSGHSGNPVDGILQSYKFHFCT